MIQHFEHSDGLGATIIGKWHLESDPTGFGYWNILPGQGDSIIRR